MQNKTSRSTSDSEERDNFNRTNLLEEAIWRTFSVNHQGGAIPYRSLDLIEKFMKEGFE